jgi:hypothetical protein
MMVQRHIIQILVGITLIISAKTQAEIPKERMERSFEYFAQGIDKLLLDTVHVYINPSDKVGTFYLNDVGVFFVGQISMTAKANMSVLINDWTKWFTGSDNKTIILDSSNDDEEKTTDNETNNEEETVKPQIPETPAVPTPPEAKIKGTKKSEIVNKSTQMKNTDKERLSNMDEHLKKFKDEMIATMLDFGSVMKGLTNKDQIVIVLFVKDSAFKEKYGTNKLMMQIPYKKFQDVQNMDPKSPEVKKDFVFTP